MSNVDGDGMDAHEQQHLSFLIGFVRRRQCLVAGIAWFTQSTWFLAVLLLILALIDRVGAESWIPWTTVIVLSCTIAMTSAVIGFLRCNPDELETARLVDNRLGLKDRLSTAVSCRDAHDPFAVAVKHDANEVARLAKTRESARRQFPIRPPSWWWATPVVLLIALLITMFGQWDLMSTDEMSSEIDLVQVRKSASESVEETIDIVKHDPMLAEAMTEALENMEIDTASALDGEDDEQSIRREALKRVTALNQELEEIVDGPEGQSLDAVEQSLSSLQKPEDSTVSELVEALSKSDFDQAAEEFAQLREKIESSELTDDERTQTAADLKQLSDQLDDLANDKQAMKDALRQAGLDPDLTDDPGAMKEAIEQSEQLNETQKDALREMADSKEQSSQMLKDLSNASQEASRQCQSGSEEKDESAATKSDQSMGDQGKGQQTLDDLAKLKKMIEQAKSAQKACESQCQKLGKGLASQQACNKPGQGVEGIGAASSVEKTDATLVSRNDSGQVGDGPVVSRTEIERELDIGESRMTLKQAQQVAREGFDEAMEDSMLPRQYHDALKHYFADRQAVDQAIRSDSQGTTKTESGQEQPDEAKEKPSTGQIEKKQ